MAYVRKTQDIYTVEANYNAYGWEEATSEVTRKEARARLAEYRDSAPEYAYRLCKRRIRILS